MWSLFQDNNHKTQKENSVYSGLFPLAYSKSSQTELALKITTNQNQKYCHGILNKQCQIRNPEQEAVNIGVSQ